jgi:hypothetical protein
METFGSPLLIEVQGVSVAFRVTPLATFFEHTLYTLEAQRIPVSITENTPSLRVTSIRTGKTEECKIGGLVEDRGCLFLNEPSLANQDKTWSLCIRIERIDEQAIKIWGSIVE